jgi:phosphoribosylformylglycinamidine synthase PurS subunit
VNERRSWMIDVIVMPKAGVNDPEGEAILGGLKMLGYGAVGRVRAGRLIRLEVAADSDSDAISQAKAMADQLLANPVIESFDVLVAAQSSEDVFR